ncbi:MAG: hypothetical protein IKN43_07465, partial [Selenomonadaceae bacterium]|nr:hypothetical protein [Selenomonadaceae bacterium]
MLKQNRKKILSFLIATSLFTPLINFPISPVFAADTVMLDAEKPEREPIGERIRKIIDNYEAEQKANEKADEKSDE